MPSPSLDGRQNRSLKENAERISELALTAINDIRYVLANGDFKNALAEAKQQFSFGRKHLRHSLAYAYGVASFYRDYPEAYAREFCQLPEWQEFRGDRPTGAEPERALYFVVRYSVGLSNKAQQKYASKYVKAMQAMFDKGVPPSEVPALLRVGGIEKLAAAASKRTSKPPVPKGPDRVEVEDLHDVAYHPGVLDALRKLEASVYRAALNDFDDLSNLQERHLRNAARRFMQNRLNALERGCDLDPEFQVIAERLSTYTGRG